MGLDADRVASQRLPPSLLGPERLGMQSEQCKTGCKASHHVAQQKAIASCEACCDNGVAKLGSRDQHVAKLKSRDQQVAKLVATTKSLN